MSLPRVPGNYLTPISLKREGLVNLSCLVVLCSYKSCRGRHAKWQFVGLLPSACIFSAVVRTTELRMASTAHSHQPVRTQASSINRRHLDVCEQDRSNRYLGPANDPVFLVRSIPCPSIRRHSERERSRAHLRQTDSCGWPASNPSRCSEDWLIRRRLVPTSRLSGGFQRCCRGRYRHNPTRPPSSRARPSKRSGRCDPYSASSRLALTA